MDFGKFVKFEILNPSENQNLRSLTLDHKISFWSKLNKFDEILTKIENLRSLTLKSKFDEITKFEILNPKIQNFQFRQNLTKNQNSATVVYHNFAIPPKFESQNFPKFVPIWANNSSQDFFKILKSIPKSQNHQNWLKSPKFWRKFLKPGCLLGEREAMAAAADFRTTAKHYWTWLKHNFSLNFCLKRNF